MSLPTYFRNAEELDCVMDGGLMADIERRIADKGLKVISWGETGAMDLIRQAGLREPGRARRQQGGDHGFRAWAR